ncbi:MAG: DUF6691 family protein [Polyangiaceae bacterium]
MTAFAAGFLFAVGLAISGMTQPAKVMGFLDVTGNWDPSLAFVMLGAIAVHFGFVQRARRRGKPFFAERFVWPELTRIDAKVLAGAAIFGLGWGAIGYCPGPAVVSLATGSTSVLLFVALMLLGMAGTRGLARRF